MATKKVNTEKNWNVQVHVKDAIFTISINANSLDEALQKSREMKDHEKLGNVDEWQDYNLEITGIY